jgi:hypothetical protein
MIPAGVFFIEMSLPNDRIEPVPEQPELKEGARPPDREQHRKEVDHIE